MSSVNQDPAGRGADVPGGLAALGGWSASRGPGQHQHRQVGGVGRRGGDGRPGADCAGQQRRNVPGSRPHSQWSGSRGRPAPRESSPPPCRWSPDTTGSPADVARRRVPVVSGTFDPGPHQASREAGTAGSSPSRPGSGDGAWPRWPAATPNSQTRPPAARHCAAVTAAVARTVSPVKDETRHSLMRTNSPRQPARDARLPLAMVVSRCEPVRNPRAALSRASHG